MPSTSVYENTTGLVLSDEYDTFSYGSSSTNTDDEILPAETSIKRICLEAKEKNIVSGEEMKLQKGTIIVKAKRFPFFAEACDREGVCDRGAALLFTTLLGDFGLIEKNCPDIIILDRYVLFRLY